MIEKGGYMEVTRKLAQIVAEADFDDLPPQVIQEAKFCFLDWLAVTLAGAGDSTLNGLSEVIELAGGNRQATVLGKNFKTSILHAALLNGMISHVLDFDDASIEFQGHPSVTLFPCLLALSEWQGKSGAEFIAAFVIGFETGCRVALGASYNHYLAGWHGTSTIGHFSSTAGCAKLLGLSPQEIVWAFGIAGTQAAGLKAVFGTSCKPFHAGKACFNGLLSALLAQRGFNSVDNILEGDKCFWDMFSSQSDPEKALEDWGATWYILKNQYKFHASCYGTHAPIDAALALKRENSLDPGKIDRIEIHVSQPMLEVAGKEKPIKGLEGKFSIHYSVANALLREDTGLNAFTDEKVNGPQVVQLRDKIKLVADHEIMPFETVVTIDAGSEQFEKKYNILEQVMSVDEKRARIFAKFRSLAGVELKRERIEEIIERVDNLENETSMADLVRLLV